MLAELLSFIIMVPLAILAWRGVAALLRSRDPNSHLANAISVATGGGQ